MVDNLNPSKESSFGGETRNVPSMDPSSGIDKEVCLVSSSNFFFDNLITICGLYTNIYFVENPLSLNSNFSF